MMRSLLLLPLATIAAPALAAPVQYVVAQTGTPDDAGAIAVEIVALNGDAAPTTLAPPQRLTGALLVDGTRRDAAFARTPGEPAEVTIPARGFARLRYVARAATPLAHGTTDIVALPTFGVSPPPQLAVAETAPSLATPAPPADSTPASVSRGNAFLGNLSAYRPIYAVYGPGTNSDARLQISFQYQLFGDPGTPAAERGLLDGVRFAYTQRMFWDLGAKSSPFRNVDYMPEVFYLAPERRVADGVLLGGQAGFQHQSNGRDGDASRSFNALYIQPMATFATGRYRISAGPRLWAYVGSQSDNPDIERYRGNYGLHADIDRDDGLRLSATSRISGQTGRGAIDAELSYPLDALIGSGPKLYLFGQGFAGYGENLLDYRRRQTRLRIGFGIVR